jgi:hypothetical protein
MEDLMKVTSATLSVTGQLVFVTTYTRFRFGKMEVVISHFRHWPRS